MTIKCVQRGLDAGHERSLGIGICRVKYSIDHQTTAITFRRGES